jgi:hypothetical protein
MANRRVERRRNVCAVLVVGILRLPLLLFIKANRLHAELRGHALAVVDALRDDITKIKQAH